MKPKKLIAVIPVAFVLLACICNTLKIPLTIPTSTNFPVQPSSTPQSETPLPPPPISGSVAPFNISWDDRSLFRQRLTSTYQGVLEQLSGASMYHLAFSLSDPPTSISGMEEVQYTNQENVALNEVDFAIFPEILGGGIKVSQVTLDGHSVDPIFSTGLMRVQLPTLLEPGRSISFHIEFSITIPTSGADSYYGIFGYNGGILSLAHAYPTVLVYNDQGWNNQTPDLDGDPLFSDTSFYLVSIDAPGNLILVASGAEVDRRESGGRQQVLYADGPSRDFYLVAGADINKQSEKVGEVTFNCFTPPGQVQYSQFILKAAEAAIGDFSRRYAPYPYTEFDVAPIITSAGGVEFPGMTAISNDIYSQNNFLESVVAHEIGHQWFYNLVGNETQQQPWLDESLAQFLTWQYFLDRYGDQAAQSFRDAIQSRWDSIDDKKIPIGEPVTAYSKEEYGAIIYGRGFFFFLALRQQIGPANFDSLMQDYTKSYEWSIATTDDFKRLAEQHCTCDLTSLFQDWVNP